MCVCVCVCTHTHMTEVNRHHHKVQSSCRLYTASDRKSFFCLVIAV